MRAFLKASTPSPATRRKAVRRATTSLVPTLTPTSRPAKTKAVAPMRAARYSGAAGSRAYFLHVPPGLPRGAQVPLVLALHGCDQTAAEFAEATRWNMLADTHHFVVAYPQQTATHHAQRCWNWFRTPHQHRGAGEPAILTGILAQIAGTRRSWSVDRSRIYVVGLSAGGGMALVLAATYPEQFAAVGVHSAPAYASATNAVTALRAMSGRATPPTPPPEAAPMPPLIVFQGTADPVVGAVNADRITEQWLAYRAQDAGAGPLRQRSVRLPPAPKRTTTSKRGVEIGRWYGPDGRKALEVWRVDGLGHAWSGGTASGSYSDRRGPRASTQMWQFFSRHRREE